MKHRAQTPSIGYTAPLLPLGLEIRVPTLFRLLFVVGILAALVYGAMLAMVTFIHPQQREISQTIVLPKPK